MYGDRESVLFPDTPTGLPTEETTLAEVLKQAGYETGLIGKWHLGHASPYLPDNHGFNYFYGLYSPHNYTTLPLMENHRGVYQDAPLPELTQLYATKAEEFVRRNSNKPFFLFYSHSYPHVPVHSSEDFTGKSLAGRYGDAVEEIDWSVGRLLEVLRECEIDSQTLIIFTSDNGPSLKHTPIQGGGAGLLRGGKGSQWEGGFRVPCIFWYPAELPSGEVNMGMASQLDLMPTITSFCNAFMPLGSVIDGIDIMPLLCGDAAKEREQFAYWIGSDLRALRKGRYKAHFTVPAVWYNETPFPRDTSHTDMLLFDIQTDPYEVNNLFKKNPGIVREFIKLRDQYQEGIPITPSIFDRRPEGSTTL
jgi:arylsulfatase